MPTNPFHLDEVDQFLGRHNLPKLTQEETDNLNRPISIKAIASVINHLPKKKVAGHMNSLVNYTKHLRKILYQFSTIFLKTEVNGILLTYSMSQSRITLISKSDKDITRKLDQSIS